MPKVRSFLLEHNMTISVLRMDGDMYESTIDILYNLYDLVDVGGMIIIDDFGIDSHIWGARDAVMDFRRVHSIEDRAHTIVDNDGSSAWFRKAREVDLQRHLYPLNVKPKVPITTAEYAACVANWRKWMPAALAGEY